MQPIKRIKEDKFQKSQDKRIRNMDMHRTVNIPGLGPVLVPNLTGTGMVQVEAPDKMYPQYSNIPEILNTAFIDPCPAEMIEPRRELLREAIPSFIAVVCRAIGQILIDEKIMSATASVADLSRYGKIASTWSVQTLHAIRVCVLSVLCTTIKPKDAKNSTYLDARYSTFCADIGTSVPTSGKQMPYDEFAAYLREKHGAIASIVAYLETHEETDRQLVALLKQIRMVWCGYGLTLTNVMYSFVEENNTALITHNTIAKEAADFKKKYEKVKKELGDFFQYAKVLKIPAVEVLNHANYPALYAAAHKWGKSVGRLSNNITLTTIHTTISDRLIDRELAKELPEGVRITSNSEELDEAYLCLGIDKRKLRPETQDDMLQRIVGLMQSMAGTSGAPDPKRPRVN